MDNNKNTLIAVALMIFVWVAFSSMFQTPTPQVPAQSPPAVVSPAVVQPPPAAPVTAVTSAAPTVTAPAELREFVVKTELYQATITTAGGRLKSFTLQNYQAQATPAAPPVDLVTASGGTLQLKGEGEFAFSEDSRFFCEEKRSLLELHGEEKVTLDFTLPLPNGTLLTRSYTFYGNRYIVEHQQQLSNPTPSGKQGRLALLLREDTAQLAKVGNTDFAGAVSLVDDKLQTDKIDQLKKGDKEYRQGLLWSAFKTKYFMQALIPAEKSMERVELHRQDDLVTHRFFTPTLQLKPGDTARFSSQLYFGPTELELLRSSGHQLERAVDLGWFSLLGLPLFHVLKFLYSFVGNYGVAIIIVTILLKLAFWPLTNKSYKSMKAMQKLQPEMQKLRDKYKNDRDRMNREIMELYKAHRVNPLGGCLPMVVQIPVFIALYNVLMNMVELRHAPFCLWITDLAARDPYYVTPLIMGATMFIQQKLTPSQMDPMQQKVFLMMPVIFTFLFLTFPSGLVLYWLVNNLLSILQQVLINRRAD